MTGVGAVWSDGPLCAAAVFCLCGAWMCIREIGTGCREMEMGFSGCVIVSRHPLGTKEG